MTVKTEVAGVRDHVVAVVVSRGSEPALAEGEREELFDLRRIELSGPPGDAVDDSVGTWFGEDLDFRLEHHAAVAVKRELGRLAGGELHGDETAALLELKDHVGRAGRMVDALDGRRCSRAGRARRRHGPA